MLGKALVQYYKYSAVYPYSQRLDEILIPCRSLSVMLYWLESNEIDTVLNAYAGENTKWITAEYIPADELINQG